MSAPRARCPAVATCTLGTQPRLLCSLRQEASQHYTCITRLRKATFSATSAHQLIGGSHGQLARDPPHHCSCASSPRIAPQQRTAFSMLKEGGPNSETPEIPEDPHLSSSTSALSRCARFACATMPGPLPTASPLDCSSCSDNSAMRRGRYLHMKVVNEGKATGECA